MKKSYLIIIAIATLLSVILGLTACLNSETNEAEIICTIFPYYDITKNILGDDCDKVKMLLKPGIDAHNYELTVRDKIAVENAKVFIYNGGESEKWVDKIIESGALNDASVLKAFDVVKLYEAEHEEHDEHELEYDEHVWLSVKNAMTIADSVCKTLIKAYPDKEEEYLNNCKDYVKKLVALDTEFQHIKDNAELNEILVADRFPFLYLARDYDIEYYAAYKGCSADTEISIQTKIELQNKLKNGGLPGVIVIEGSTETLAKSLLANDGGGKKIYKLNSLQTISEEELQSGAGYLEIMSENAKILKDYLSKKWN